VTGSCRGRPFDGGRAHDGEMSNISTAFVRIYARRDDRIDQVEARWITSILLGERGSYHVPVWIRLSPLGDHVDVQYGSSKSAGLLDFCDYHIGGYEAIWGRSFYDGGDEDMIWQDHARDGQMRFCRYGFDEVRVQTDGDGPPVAPDAAWVRGPDGSWRLPVAGSYRTGNDRTILGCDPGPAPRPIEPSRTGLATPTTPCEWGRPLIGTDPSWLAPFGGEGPAVSAVSVVEFRWRGRLVHRVRQDATTFRGWQHRCADDWDNCLDPAFLRYTGASSPPSPDGIGDDDHVHQDLT
jgi:hypothetical protein